MNYLNHTALQEKHRGGMSKGSLKSSCFYSDDHYRYRKEQKSFTGACQAHGKPLKSLLQRRSWRNSESMRLTHHVTTYHCSSGSTNTEELVPKGLQETSLGHEVSYCPELN